MLQAKSLGLAVAAVALLGVAGCAAPPRGGADYRGYETRTEQSVRFGVVESIRNVRINATDTGVGTTSGAVLGGIAGSTVGHGRGSVAGAVAGAVIGGIIGSAVEKDANFRDGVEITVMLDGGKYIAVVQEADETFRVGDRVRILSGRGATRVSH
ncbi:MAG: glycine zipper 2TM domain-containing protein [Burkholderiales bacterium]|jgi:outer membrane lipoprotein SlyB|nr:glycine zipper 2TM domain-containing protein [Burkholderiales bacterium]MBZ0248758.1 glycine zipper 2TM domain-containing protein [Burkholderiales bacterium]MCL4689292.1 glycine zipper 2TM domain-containing protein [Burkholderiales bacterium]